MHHRREGALLATPLPSGKGHTFTVCGVRVYEVHEGRRQSLLLLLEQFQPFLRKMYCTRFLFSHFRFPVFAPVDVSVGAL